MGGDSYKWGLEHNVIRMAKLRRAIFAFTALSPISVAVAQTPAGPARRDMANAALPTARTNLGLGTISVYDYGMVPANANNATNFNNAYAAACAAGRDLFIPAGSYSFTAALAPFTQTCGIRIRTAGRENTVFTFTDVNACAMTVAVNTASVDNLDLSELTLRGYFPTGGPYTNSRGICFTGDLGTYLQYSTFTKLRLVGFYDAFNVSKLSAINWSTFDDIIIENFSKGTINGFHFTAGSGTGNTYTNIKANVGDSGSVTPGSVFTFDTAGVVGDVLITSGHWGGVDGSIGVTVGSGTTYRSRISFGTTQFDAGMVYPLKLDSGGEAYTDIRIGDSNNIGGGTDLYTNVPPIKNSVIVDQGVSRWESSYTCANGLPSGLNTIEIFQVDAGATDFVGTTVDLTVSGLVGGVTADVVTAKYQIINNNGTLTLVRPQYYQGAAEYALTTSLAGGITTFNLVFTATNPGSTCDAQIKATGGPVRIKRG